MPKTIDHIGELTPDPKNARAHTPRNLGTIVDSLHEVGAARSIVIDEDGVILAGNATVEAAGEAGIEKVRVIDASGDEIIAVRRTGLSPEQKIRLALADNRAAEFATWNPDVLKELAEEGHLDRMWSENEQELLLTQIELADVQLGEFEAPPQTEVHYRVIIDDLTREAAESIVAEVEGARIEQYRR